MNPRHRHLTGDPLTDYLAQAKLGWQVLRFVARRWRDGWTTTVEYVAWNWRGIHSKSTVAHTFTELHRLGALVRLGNGRPWVYRPKRPEDVRGYALRRKVG